MKSNSESQIAESDKTNILAKGVDSLYLYLDEGLNFARLSHFAEQLRIGETALICGLEFERDRAYAKAFPVSLRHSFYLFYINCASLYIKVAALAFEMLGFDGTLSKLYQILDTLINRKFPWYEHLRVSRIDVFCDFRFEEDFDDKRFKTRLRRRGVFISGKHAEGKTYYFGDRSRFCVRLYIKSTEIKVSGKMYLRPIWLERGLASDENRVWRLEFEYRRRKLERLYERLSLAEIGGHLDELWSYGIDKLTYMTDRAENRNIHRKQVHPVWQQLEESLFQEYHVVSEQVRHADIEYRRKRAVKWICSHSVALGHNFENLPKLLKTQYKITALDYERAVENFNRLFFWL